MSFNLSICPAEINKYCSLGDVVNGTLVSCNSSFAHHHLQDHQHHHHHNHNHHISIRSATTPPCPPTPPWATTPSPRCSASCRPARSSRPGWTRSTRFVCCFCLTNNGKYLSETKIQITLLILRRGALSMINRI